MKVFLATTTLAILIATSVAVTMTPETLPEIHLRVDEDDLFHPKKGIYTNFDERGSDSERPATFEFRSPRVSPPVRAEIGLRVHGGRSREFPQKSLRLYFDRGSGPLEADLFSGPPTRFARLILRNNQTAARCLNTNLMEPLFQELGHLGSRWTPVLVTLNGADWGVYSLRERFDAEFVTVTLGHEGEFTLIRDGETEHGDGDAWWIFLDSFGEPVDRAAPGWLDEVRRRMDITSYIDWLIINIFGAAADNGGAHNLTLLKLDRDPWCFLMWDEDDLFQPANLDNDHFRWFAAADKKEYRQFQPPVQITGTWKTRAPWSALFRGLLENPEFRTLFFARAETLLDGELSVANLSARLDALVVTFEPGLARHADRWEWSSPQDLRDQADEITAWITARHPIVREQLEAFRARY